MALFKKKEPVTERAAKAEVTKTYVFCGAENGMFIYHFAMVLKAADKAARILIVDNSKHQDLFNPLPGDSDIKSLNDTWVLSGRDYPENLAGNYEYCIGYLGENADHGEWLKNADKVWFMYNYTTYIEDYLVGLDKSMVPRESEMIFVGLSKATNKVKEASVMKKMACFNKGAAALVMECAVEDIAAYTQFLYNGRQGMNSMSPDWKDVIKEAVQIVTDRKHSDLKKIVKNMN